jgi:iron complex outermembrane receptor protein
VRPEVLFALALATASVAVHSAEPPPATEEPIELETVTVRANPLGRTSDELIQPHDVLSGDVLVDKRRPTIGETLEFEPGVATSDFGAGAGRPVIRGQAGPRVQVLENGLGSLDVSDVSPDHAVTVSPAQATQIEVIKGPATLLFGSGASGGVVNIANHRLPSEAVDGVHANFEGFYGTNANERSGAAEINAGFGRHVLHGDFGARKMGDYDIPGNASVDGSGSEGALANSRNESRAGAMSYGYIADEASIAGAISRFTSNYGLPNEETAFIDMRQTRYDLQGILLQPFAGFESLKLRGAYNDYTHTEFEDVGIPGTVFLNRQQQQRLEGVHAPVGKWRGVVGVQHGFRAFEGIGEEAFVPSTDTRDLGVFIVEERPFRGGRFEAGARLERDTNRPADLPSRDFTLASFSAGSTFDLGEDYHAKLNVTRAQRAPVPQELYAFGPHVATGTFERGSVDADRETANNFEIGFDHHGDRLAWEASVFYERFQDYLYLASNDVGLDADGAGTADSDGIADRVDEAGVFDPQGEFLLVDYRQGSARFYGFEAEASYVVLNGPTRLAVNAFGDLVRGSLAGGSNLPRIEPARVGLGIEGSAGPLRGEVHFVRVQAQDRIAPLETRTDGYNMLSVDLRYHFHLDAANAYHSQVFVMGRNLLDEEARRATSFIKDVAPLPGRSIVIGVRLEI